MEAKEQSQWRANLRAMQLRVKERLRIPSSPRAFLLRHLQRSGRAAAHAYANKALVGVAGGAKPLNALLSTVLTKQLNLATATASSSSCAGAGSGLVGPANRNPDRFVSTPGATTARSISEQQIESNYTAVFGEKSYAVRLLQAVALPVIGNVCHAFMHGFNRTEVYSAEKLLDAVSHRPQGQALITVSNHVASMDDPLVIAAILPPHVLLHANCLRWTLCATDRCFANCATSAFFRCVKVLPLARGAGVYQKGVDMAVEKLRRGDWIHIFPEGSRSRDGGKTIQGAKRGIGRLVLDAGDVPLVIPFVHSGMQEVMPIGSKFPTIRKRVVVLVGDPIKMDDLFSKSQEGGVSKDVIHEAIAFRVGQHLKKLKAELDQLVLSSSDIKQKQSISEEVSSVWTNDEAGYQVMFNCKEGNSEQMIDHKYGDHQLNVNNVFEDFRLRASFETSDEALHSDSRLLARVSMNSFQEGIVTRLKRCKDPAVFVGFAAQGLLRYSHTCDIGKLHLKENCSC